VWDGIPHKENTRNEYQYVTEFGKINHFVTFDTSNIYGQNNVLHSTSQPYREYKVSVYTELPENL